MTTTPRLGKLVVKREDTRSKREGTARREGRTRPGAATETAISVVLANEASCDDLRVVFSAGGYASSCHCQRFKLRHSDWHALPVADRAARLRAQTGCGDPGARSTSGLIAFLDGEPVGWCAVEPRTAYLRLMQAQTRVPWAGRTEDKTDASVWAATCFITRAGFRRRGVSRALARASVDFAKARGARAIEGYPMIVEPGQDITWGELNVGSRSIFAAAGFVEVSRPALRRCVMRIDF